MKLSFDIKGASIIDSLKKRLSLGLWIFLLVVALFSGYIIFQEVKKITQANADTSGITGETVRVNISQHQALEQRLNENLQFSPEPIPGADAFGAQPETRVP
jgi:hypothetical protein